MTTRGGHQGPNDLIERLDPICWLMNQEALALRGDPGTCILSAGALRDALRIIGHEAEVLRVEVSVHLQSGSRDQYGCVLGLIGGDGPRRAAKPGMWKGHLVTIAEGLVLLDPTLPQVNVGHPWLAAEPMTVPVTPAFLAGTETFRVPTGSAGATASYWAFPARGGWKHAPDFRPSRRRELADRVLLGLYQSKRGQR